MNDPLASSDRKVPTILIVGMPDSIHTVRWVNMVRGPSVKIVLLPAYLVPPAPELVDWRPVRSEADVAALPEGSVGVFDLSVTDRDEAWSADESHGHQRLSPVTMTVHRGLTTPHDVVRAAQLLRPDLVHSLEIQLAGYIVNEAKRRLGPGSPPWLLSNWGSDIYLYERLPEHRPIVLDVVRRMDGYIAECQRDVSIVRSLGFAGVAFEPTPASGGQDFSDVPKLADLPPPSQRDIILIKGYHGWAGRGLHILSAVHLVAPELRRYRIRTLFTSPAIKETSRMLAEHDGLDIAPARHLPSHSEALARLGQARMVVSMGVSDGISTTLLEAMSLGAFPIQGDTSCACEWIENGRDGFLLSPHDVAGLGRAIVRAAGDDDLVDAAALRNRQVVEQRWDVSVNRAKALGYYGTMLRAGSRPADRRRS